MSKADTSKRVLVEKIESIDFQFPMRGRRSNSSTKERLNLVVRVASLLVRVTKGLDLASSCRIIFLEGVRGC